MSKSYASSSGDTTHVHPYTTRDFWIKRLEHFKKENRSEYLLNRVNDIISDFRVTPDFLPKKD